MELFVGENGSEDANVVEKNTVVLEEGNNIL